MKTSAGADCARRQRREALQRDGERRHDQAVIEAEVRRLVNGLGPFQILRRDALARAVGAEHWRGGFGQALRAAVQEGRLEALPFDFYRLARPAARARRPTVEDR